MNGLGKNILRDTEAHVSWYAGENWFYEHILTYILLASRIGQYESTTEMEGGSEGLLRLIGAHLAKTVFQLWKERSFIIWKLSTADLPTHIQYYHGCNSIIYEILFRTVSNRSPSRKWSNFPETIGSNRDVQYSATLHRQEQQPTKWNSTQHTNNCK